MTREEAYNRIDAIIAKYEIDDEYVTITNPKDYDAFRIARKILEQQPCEDWCDVPSDEMTLEQARQAVNNLRKMLAEYLEQEPCKDAISRQAVLNMQYRIDDSATLSTRDVVNVDDIKDLLPVTPQPKTGHWIEVDTNMYACSNCSHCFSIVPEDNSIKQYHYCPNCMTKMS